MKPAICLALLLLAASMLALVGCGGSSSGKYTRAQKSQEMETLARVVKAKNRATKIANRGEQLSMDDMREIVSHNRDALRIAEALDVDVLNDVDSGLGDLVRDKLIAGLRLYILAFSDESANVAGQLRAQIMLDEWGNEFSRRRRRGGGR